jgi:hypothetical protein
MNKNTTNNNNKNKKTIRRKKLIRGKRHKCTQKNGIKHETKYGGTKPNVCNELPELKNSLDIFKYAIQLPKITK